MIHTNLNILINALSTHNHMIHINLNTFYTHVEHRPSPPTKTIYIKYYNIYMDTHTHTAMNSNVHDTDLYHTSYMHVQTHTHTHSLTVAHTTVAETGY